MSAAPPGMQPTLRLVLPASSQEATAKLRQAIRTPDLAGRVESAAQCFDFKVEHADRRLWSPHLSVQISDLAEADGAPRAELFGRFSPRPEVWTLVMFCYFAAVFVIACAGVFGYVQWVLGRTPWALGLIPVALGAMVALHVVSLVGQRLSADQMTLLRSRLDRAVELAFGDQSDAPPSAGASAVAGLGITNSM